MTIRCSLVVTIFMLCSTLIVAPPPALPDVCTPEHLEKREKELHETLSKKFGDKEPGLAGMVKVQAIEPCVRAMVDTEDVQFNHNLDDSKLTSWVNDFDAIHKNFELIEAFTAGRDTCIICHKSETLKDKDIHDFKLLDKYPTLMESRASKCKAYSKDSQKAKDAFHQNAQKGCDLAVKQCESKSASCRPATSKGRGLYGYFGVKSDFATHGSNIMSCTLKGAKVLNERKKFTSKKGEVSVEDVLKGFGVLLADQTGMYLSFTPFDAMEQMFARIGLFYSFVSNGNGQANANKGAFTSFDHCCIHLDEKSKVTLKGFNKCDEKVTPKPRFSGRRISSVLSPY
jgi:hypothetical protein